MKLSLECVTFTGDDGHRLQPKSGDKPVAEIEQPLEFTTPPELEAAITRVFAPEPKDSEE